jgi:hypothetical protein
VRTNLCDRGQFVRRVFLRMSSPRMVHSHSWFVRAYEARENAKYNDQGGKAYTKPTKANKCFDYQMFFFYYLGIYIALYS